MTGASQVGNENHSPSPRVSVIIPAYSSASFIPETLDSVFAQTFSNYEIIVINDGSPDAPALEAALQPYIARIVYLTQRNGGPASARNTGIRHARGEFVAFLDSDDVWFPTYLEAQVRFLDGHPQADASIADALLFGESRDETPWTMLKGTGNMLGFNEMLRRRGGQIPSACMARRRRVIEVGMFDEHLLRAEDLELFVRISFPDRAVGYLGKVLVKYRKHPASLTSDPGNRKWRVAETEALRRLGEKLALSDLQRGVLDREIAAAEAALALEDAYRHASAREFEEATQSLRSANKFYRSSRIAFAIICLNAFPKLAGRLLNWRANRRVGTGERKI